MKEPHHKKYDYLGMDLGFSVDGQFRLKIMDYLNKIVYDFPETIQVRQATPEAKHMFTVVEDTNIKLLGKDRTTAFHHSVAQLLFITSQVRKYIQTAVAFFTTTRRTGGNYDECYSTSGQEFT